MEKEILRKVQLTQLEIAKEIRRVCEENDIRYYLADGTMLGAVRHNGFIPWDDDMDIGMLREDYEKFCRIAPEKLKQGYIFQNWYTEPNYGLPFGKVLKLNTVYLEGKKTKHLKENGFYVDIFPADNVPADADLRAKLAKKVLKLYRIKLMKSGYQPWIDNGKFRWKKRIGYYYYQFLALFRSQQKLATEFDTLACSCMPTGWMREETGTPKPRYIASSVFTEFAEYEFEGEKFAGVKDYDTYLTALYGEYMQLPPEDQRENRHQIIEIDFGREDGL